MNCYCSSGKTFDSCCGPFLSNEQFPETAEELMRSRYSAYATSNMDYLEQTQTFKEGEFDKEGALKWAKESEWKGLQILDTEKGQKGDKSGVVEFVAHYKNKQGLQAHHEIASFTYKNKWFFESGYSPDVQTYRRESPKVGRNDPCPCGSGKKFKKCCG